MNRNEKTRQNGLCATLKVVFAANYPVKSANTPYATGGICV